MALVKLSSSLILLFLASACSSTESVERPCGEANSVDKDCVRAQLAARSGCTPTYGDGLDNITAPDVFMQSNFFNLTLLKRHSTYTGIENTEILDYVIDSKNSVNILLLKHVAFHAGGPLDLVFHKLGQASLNVTTVYSDTYYNVQTTVIIPGTDNIDITKRQSYLYETTSPDASFGDEHLQYYIDNDELVNATVTAINNNLYIVIHDALFSMTKVVVDAFINLGLCGPAGREPLYQVPTL